MSDTIKCGVWLLVSDDIGDDDMRHRYTHTARNRKTGELIELRFSSYNLMTKTAFECFCDIGLKTTNSVLGYPNAAWTNQDLELAWYRKNYPRG